MKASVERSHKDGAGAGPCVAGFDFQGIRAVVVSAAGGAPETLANEFWAV